MIVKVIKGLLTVSGAIFVGLSVLTVVGMILIYVNGGVV
jgi:hypothetical protein